MRHRLGLYLGAGHAAAWMRGRPPFEGPFDLDRPDALTESLRSHFGHASRISLAVGLDMLEFKPLALPAVSNEARRQVLALEPDRYFPVAEHGRYLVAVAGEPPIAFLAQADPLAQLVASLESWTRVERIEPAALSALRTSRDRTRVLPAGDTDALVRREGRSLVIRRQPRGESVTCPLLDVARGAASAIDAPLDETLMPDALAGRVRRTRAARLVTAATAVAASAAFAWWAADRARERLLHRLDAAIAVDSARAAPALGLAASAGTSRHEREVVGAMAGSRPDPLAVLSALSTILPRNVVLQKVEATADAWRIEGTARSASALVPLLDADPRFTDVRALGPSTRFDDAGRTVETFAIAFRARR